MSNLILETVRDAYSIDQLSETMTVEEMIDFLSNFDPETKIFLSFDNGYTFGSVSEYRFKEEE